MQVKRHLRCYYPPLFLLSTLSTSALFLLPLTLFPSGTNGNASGTQGTTLVEPPSTVPRRTGSVLDRAKAFEKVPAIAGPVHVQKDGFGGDVGGNGIGKLTGDHRWKRVQEKVVMQRIAESMLQAVAENGNGKGSEQSSEVEKANARYNFADSKNDEWWQIPNIKENAERLEEIAQKHRNRIPLDTLLDVKVWRCDGFGNSELQARCKAWLQIHTVLKGYAKRLKAIDVKKGDGTPLDPLLDFEVPPLFLGGKLKKVPKAFHYVISQISNAYKVAQSAQGANSQKLQEPVFQSGPNVELIERTQAWKAALQKLRAENEKLKKADDESNKNERKENDGDVPIPAIGDDETLSDEEIGLVYLRPADGTVITLAEMQSQAEKYLKEVASGERKAIEEEAPQEEPAENREKRKQLAADWTQKWKEFKAERQQTEVAKIPPYVYLDLTGNPVNFTAKKATIFEQLRRGETPLAKLEEPPKRETDNEHAERIRLYKEWKQLLGNANEEMKNEKENQGQQNGMKKLFRFYYKQVYDEKHGDKNGENKTVKQILVPKELGVMAETAVDNLLSGMFRLDQLPTMPESETDQEFEERNKLIKEWQQILDNAKEEMVVNGMENGGQKKGLKKLFRLYYKAYDKKDDEDENGEGKTGKIIILPKELETMAETALEMLSSGTYRLDQLPNFPERESEHEFGEREKLIKEWQQILENAKEEMMVMNGMENGGQKKSTEKLFRLYKVHEKDDEDGNGGERIAKIISPKELKAMAETALEMLSSGKYRLDQLPKVPEPESDQEFGEREKLLAEKMVASNSDVKGLKDKKMSITLEELLHNRREEDLSLERKRKEAMAQQMSPSQNSAADEQQQQSNGEKPATTTKDNKLKLNAKSSKWHHYFPKAVIGGFLPKLKGDSGDEAAKQQNMTVAQKFAGIARGAVHGGKALLQQETIYRNKEVGEHGGQVKVSGTSKSKKHQPPKLQHIGSKAVGPITAVTKNN